MGKDRNKYINGAFYVVVVLILIAFLIFIISKVNFNKDDSDIVDKDKNEVLEIKKLDDTKEYVYDALYNLSTDKDSYYVDDHTKEIKASDIVVPYINIDNNDARLVNTEIYSLYEELINDFNKNLVDEIFYTLVEYESYVNNDILSIVIYTESAGTSMPIYQYYTYNFDLVTGSLLKYDEVLSKMNLDRTSVDGLVGDVLANTIHSICDGDVDGSNQYCMTDNYTYEVFYNQSMTSYEDRVNEGSIKFYINNNQLYVVLNPQNPTQSSGTDRLFNISIGEEIR